jgi:hypothetical protein
MNTKLKSPLVGFLSMLFIDSLARVIFTVYHGIDFAPFSYVIYPDYWSWLMLGISIIGAFFGAMMVITFSGSKWFPFITYILLLILWRLAPYVPCPLRTPMDSHHFHYFDCRSCIWKPAVYRRKKGGRRKASSAKRYVTGK